MTRAPFLPVVLGRWRYAYAAALLPVMGVALVHFVAAAGVVATVEMLRWPNTGR